MATPFADSYNFYREHRKKTIGSFAFPETGDSLTKKHKWLVYTKSFFHPCRSHRSLARMSTALTHKSIIQPGTYGNEITLHTGLLQITRRPRNTQTTHNPQTFTHRQQAGKLMEQQKRGQRGWSKLKRHKRACRSWKGCDDIGANWRTWMYATVINTQRAPDAHTNVVFVGPFGWWHCAGDSVD